MTAVPSWLHLGYTSDHRFVGRCDVCNEQQLLPTAQHVQAFITAHANHTSEAAGWLGAGDLVHASVAAARRAGLPVKPCAPCEKRRKRMNRLAPKMWRKRRK